MKSLLKMLLLTAMALAMFGCNNGPNYTYKDYTGTYTFIPDPSNDLVRYQLIMNGDRAATLNYYTNYISSSSSPDAAHAAAIAGDWPYAIVYDSRVSPVGFYEPNRLGISNFYGHPHAQFVKY